MLYLLTPKNETLQTSIKYKWSERSKDHYKKVFHKKALFTENYSNDKQPVRKLLHLAYIPYFIKELQHNNACKCMLIMPLQATLP
jgi:hypothetical protein